MHDYSALLTSVDRRLHHRADFLRLSNERRKRARSLAMAIVVATVFHLTPTQLFELLKPAFIKYLQSQGMEVRR